MDLNISHFSFKCTWSIKTQVKLHITLIVV